MLYDKLILVIFGFKTLGTYDRLMMEDNPDNWSNILAAFRFEKLDYLELKEHLFDRLKHIDRCTSKMVKFFGVWYFQKMSDEEFEK